MIAHDFLHFRDILEVSDTAAAILVLADRLNMVGHSEHGETLAECITDLVRCLSE